MGSLTSPSRFQIGQADDRGHQLFSKPPPATILPPSRMSKAGLRTMSNLRAEEYRKKASACREEAKKGLAENEAKWLELAERWEEAAEKIEGFGHDERQRLEVLQGAAAR